MNERNLWLWLLLDIYSPSVIAAIARGSLITVMPLYLISVGYTPAQVGIGTAAISIGTVAFDLPGISLLKRVGERALMRISLAFITGTALFMFLFINPILAILLSVIFGGGRSLWLLSRRYVISYYLDYKIRGRASSFVGASERIGIFIGPAIVAALIEISGYEGIFLIIFILSLIATLMNVISDLIILKHSLIKEIKPSKSLNELSFVLGKRSLQSLTITQFLVQGIRSSRLLLIPLVGKILLGISDSAVGYALTLTGALEVIGAYPAGLIMDKKGRYINALISFIIMAVGFISLAISYNEWTFYLSSFIIGLGNGFSAGLLVAVGSDISFSMGKEQGSSFLGYWQFSGDAGSASFPVIIGEMAEVISLFIISILVGTLCGIVALSSSSSLKKLDHIFLLERKQ